MPEDSVNPINAAARSHSGTTVNPGDLEDAALLVRIQSGDQLAMANIFRRYSTIVYSVAMRVLKDPGEAEDITQQIFVQIWKNPGAYVAGRGSLGGWLAVVARNRSIDQIRRRHPSDPIELFTLPSATDLGKDAERAMMIEKVCTAMRDLPIEQREMVELAFFEGMTHTEIAEKTGDPLGTVKTRIRLALLSLRKVLAA